MTGEEAIQICKEVRHCLWIADEQKTTTIWDKGAVSEAMLMAIEALKAQDRPRGEFDGMIFSTDKYMAFIDKKEIHIMRKDAHKVTVERMFNTEEDDK